MPKKSNSTPINQTQEERKEMISQVFDMFDKDGNGEIETSELKAVLTAMGRKPDLRRWMSFTRNLTQIRTALSAKRNSWT